LKDTELISPEMRNEVDARLEELRELGEIWPDLSTGDSEEAAERASDISVALLEQEIILQIGCYERQLSEGKGHTSPWPGVVLRAIPAAELAGRQRTSVGQTRVKPDPADQAQLDELLGLVTRPSVARLRFQDFQSSWPDRVTTPFQFLTWDQDEVEHAFKDAQLEAERRRLIQAANDFLYKEAMNGFPSDAVPHLRNAGYSAGEAEGLPEREALIKPRLETIRTAAAELVAVYDELVITAKEKGYDLSAMKAEIHPKVAEHDQRIAEI